MTVLFTLITKAGFKAGIMIGKSKDIKDYEFDLILDNDLESEQNFQLVMQILKY